MLELRQYYTILSVKMHSFSNRKAPVDPSGHNADRSLLLVEGPPDEIMD